MTALASILKLEVNTNPTDNLLRNPSGKLGLVGVAGNNNLSVLTGSALAAAEDGFAFKLPNFTTDSPPNRARLLTASFPVRAGTQTEFGFTAQGAGAISLTPSVNRVNFGMAFYDASGKWVGAIQAALNNGPQIDKTARAYSIYGLAPERAATAMAQISVYLGGARAEEGYAAVSRMWARSGIANGAAVGAYKPAEWLNIIGKSTSITTEQGNDLKGVEDELAPGTLVATMLDSSIDPATSNVLDRGRAIRLTATTGGKTTPVWAGVIETADVDYDETKGRTAGRPPRIVVTATDDARKIGEAGSASTIAAGFNDQVGRALQAANVAGDSGSGSLTVDVDDVGRPIIASAAILARDDSAKASDWIRRACNTHGGYAWVDAANRVQYRLVSYLPVSPVATLSDSSADSGALYYTSIGLNFGSRSLTNALTVKRYNRDEVDDDGAKEYGPYVASESEARFGRITGSIEITSGSPSAIAAVVLPAFATPRIFPTAIKFNTVDNILGVLALGPYAPVRVKRVAPSFDAVVRVLRVRHEIRARAGGDSWVTTITPRPMESTAPAAITVPGAGADTGPSDIIPPTPGLLSDRFRSGALNVGGGYISVPFDGASVSDGITWDATNNRWVISKDGRYHVSASVYWQGGAAGLRSVQIAVNGARRMVNDTEWVANTGAQTLDKTLKLAAGDVVAIQVLQTSGGTRWIYGDNANATTASIAYIGP